MNKQFLFALIQKQFILRVYNYLFINVYKMQYGGGNK